MYNTQEDLNIQQNGCDSLTFLSFKIAPSIPKFWYRQSHVLRELLLRLHIGTEMGIKIYRDHFHGIYNNLVNMHSMQEVHKNAYRGDHICLYMSVRMFQATLGCTRRIFPRTYHCNM